MKIQYASDLHLEFRDNSRWLRDNPLIPEGDILLLAGDIGYLEDEMYERHPFWDWCADNFARTIIVPGNHELYKGVDINKLTDDWELDIRSNVKAVYNKVVRVENIDIVATTLWAKIHPAEAFYTEQCVSDFHRIRSGEGLLTWDRFNDEHERCVDFIRRSIMQSTASKRVVLTHHVPSFELMAEEFKGSMLNGAFTCELSLLMESLPIDYWIYGHSHRNIEATIGNTHILSNQLGYVFHNEHDSFKRNAVIEL